MLSTQQIRTRQVTCKDGTVSEIDYYLLPQWYVDAGEFDCELIEPLVFGKYSCVVRRADGSCYTVFTHELRYTFEIVRFANSPQRFPERLGSRLFERLLTCRSHGARDKARNAWL